MPLESTRTGCNPSADQVTASLGALAPTGHDRILAAVSVIWLTDSAVRAGRLLVATRSSDDV